MRMSYIGPMISLIVISIAASAEWWLQQNVSPIKYCEIFKQKSISMKMYEIKNTHNYTH
jgi:hypothetical protein